MKLEQAIERLKQEREKNPVADILMTEFATRQRARRAVTVKAISRKLDGYRHPIAAYEGVFKLLADLGLGTLVMSPKGRVEALKDIKVTLQSIGQSVLGDTPRLDGFRPKTTYKRVETPKALLRKSTLKATVLTFMIHGKPINVSIPEDMSSAEIGTLVQTLAAL